LRVLVTGAGGFLGGHLARLLVERGEEVRALVRTPTNALAGLDLEQVQGDLRSQSDLDRISQGIKIVYHVAARAGIFGAFKDFYDTNVLGTQNLIRACLKNRVERLVFTSSPSVIFTGEDQKNLDEALPYPVHYLAHYPRTKALAEQFVLEANREPGLCTCSLRPHLIWGPGDNHLIPRFLQRAREGSLKVVGDGENLVDTVYVEDAARAHLLAAEKLEPKSPVCGQAYFISQGDPVRLMDWMNRFVEAAGLSPICKKIPFPVAYGLGVGFEVIYKALRIKKEPRMTRFLALQLARDHYYSLEKARNDLGYEPQFTMEEAYNKLFESPYFKDLTSSLTSRNN
jgi:2-alkyl-3-oxoalkanoate reductase